MFLDRSKDDVSYKDNVVADSSVMLEVPPSWVKKLEISKEKLESQYPNFTKTIVYSKCILVIIFF